MEPPPGTTDCYVSAYSYGENRLMEPFTGLLIIVSPLLLRRKSFNGAGEGDRTLATSLEGWGSTTELHPQK